MEKLQMDVAVCPICERVEEGTDKEECPVCGFLHRDIFLMGIDYSNKN